MEETGGWGPGGVESAHVQAPCLHTNSDRLSLLRESNATLVQKELLLVISSSINLIVVISTTFL